MYENKDETIKYILDTKFNCIFYKLDVETIYRDYCMKEKIYSKFKDNITNYDKFIWINNENDLSLVKLDICNQLRNICIKLPIKIYHTSTNKYYQLTDGEEFYLGADKKEMINTFTWKQMTSNIIPISCGTVCLMILYIIKKLKK